MSEELEDLIDHAQRTIHKAHTTKRKRIKEDLKQIQEDGY